MPTHDAMLDPNWYIICKFSSAFAFLPTCGGWGFEKKQHCRMRGRLGATLGEMSDAGEENARHPCDHNLFHKDVCHSERPYHLKISLEDMTESM